MRFILSTDHINLPRVYSLTDSPSECLIAESDVAEIWDNADPDSSKFVGVVFMTRSKDYPETRLHLSLEPQYQNGQWLEVWPDILGWTHGKCEEVKAITHEEKLANFMMKLGGASLVKEIVDQRGNPDVIFWIVTFDKSSSDQFLATTDLAVIKSINV